MKRPSNSSGRSGQRLDRAQEYKLFYALGIDGLFSDFPDTALEAREEFFEG